MKKILLSIALVGVYSAYAQDVKRLTTQRVESDNSIVWRQISPGNSGMASMLRYHPTLPNVVTFCPDMWNAYQSEDNGESWYNIVDPDGDGSFHRHHDLVYSSKNPRFGLAICASELWQTHDMGRSWKIVTNCPWYYVDQDGSDRHNWVSKVGTVAIDPNDTNVWYVGGGSNVRGQDWMSCMHGANAQNPHYGREYTTMGSLWKSTDAGKSWSLINKGMHPKVQVARFILNPTNSRQVFAASNYGLYRSNNGGESWDQISKGKLESDIIMDFDLYYNKESGIFRLYLIDQVQYIPDGETTKCRGGIFYSDDLGETWNKINGNISLDFNRLKGGVANNYYNFLSRWFGITAKEAKVKYPKLPTETIQYLSYICVDPSRKDALYVGLEDPQIQLSILPGRLWATTNNGESWISTARLYEDVWAADKEYWEERGNPWHENMVVGHGSPHMQNGKNYAQRSMRGLSVGVDGSVMIISDHSTSLSTNHGKSWHQVDEHYTPSGAIIGRGNSDMPALVIAQDQRNSATILGSGEHKAWIPTYDDPEGRIALKYIKSAPDTVIEIVFDPYDGDVAYLTSSRQAGKQYIFRSEDRGHTWAKHGVATPASDKWNDDFYTAGLTIDPINSQYLYLGITRISDKQRGGDAGFYRSIDGGKSFQQCNNGLPEIVRINDICFDPRDESRKSLFAAAQWGSFDFPKPTEGGVYFSADRGDNWVKVSTPKQIKSVQSLMFDQSNRLYITTGYRVAGGGGAGVWYSDDYGKSWHQCFSYSGADCIDVSPYDRNLIVVSVRFLSKNPGIYISRDRGKTWSKSNRDIPIPQQIEDVKFDLFNAGELWAATLGCGYYKGVIEGGESIQVVDSTPNSFNLKQNEKVTLEAKIINPKYAGEQIVWRTENPSIATVNNKGVVTAKGRGHVKIWASTSDGRFTDYSAVTVMP